MLQQTGSTRGFREGERLPGGPGFALGPGINHGQNFGRGGIHCNFVNRAGQSRIRPFNVSRAAIDGWIHELITEGFFF